jgi:two-component system, NarL family, sensor histidine kinase UhpB
LLPTVPETLDRYRQLVERSPNGIFISRDSRIVFLNPAALQIAGARNSGEVVGTPLRDLFHAESQPALDDLVAKCQSGEATPAVDAVFVRRDGTTIDVDVAGAAIEEADGAALQIVVRDITERRRTEAALRQSEERLSLAFAGAQEGVWDWNLATGAVVYSDRWREMLGYSEAEIEPHVSAWERLLHPDDKARADEMYASVMHGAQSYEGELRLRHKDGRYVHVLSRGLPIRREPDGAVVRIVGTHFDLTERRRAEAALRESEERLTLAFEGAQEGVWDWNLETGAVLYSPQWKKMLGYSEEEIEPHVSAWERLLHPDDMPRAEQASERVARGEQAYEGEFRLRHKDGRYVHVLSRGLPVRREPGGPAVRIVGTHFDLTERRHAEEIRDRERAERARTEFLGRLMFAQEDERRRIAREMHDQFGEQLTALSRRIGLLKQACTSHPELQPHIDALDDVSAQLDRDVDHLVWELRPTALDDLGLRAALANYVANWSKRVGIPAELHTNGLLDDRLSSEVETTLYRIAQEGLTNVAKHAQARHVEVLLERRHDHVLLIIEDDGVGFDRGKPAAAGDGFGLRGMEERAALVGATVDIDSAIGRGTTVLVRMATAAASSAIGQA